MTLENKLLTRKICNVISFTISLLFMVTVFFWTIGHHSISLWLFVIPLGNLLFLYTSRSLTDPYT